MPFLGTIVNFLVVLAAGMLGSLIKKSIPERISNSIMSGMAICVIYIGISGALEQAPALSEGSFLSPELFKILVMILSMAIGTLIGELIDIDKWIGRLGSALESKLSSSDRKNGKFARGFVSCSLLFCVGAMAVNGSMMDAVGQPDILLAKTVIDGISCFIMSTTLGIGCALSAFLVLLYQGALTVLGLGLNHILSSEVITYMSVTGSLVVTLVGTNVLGCTNVKTANMIPAIFTPILVAPLLNLLT